MDYMYRFRGIDKIIGEKYQELERQEIYFASSDKLNDPMEGFKDMVWQGDYVLWQNLLEHYLMCLTYIVDLMIIGGDSKKIDSEDILVFKSKNKFTTDYLNILFENIKIKFFSEENISKIPHLLAMRKYPIIREELSLYLSLVHIHALKSIYYVIDKTNNFNNLNNFKIKKIFNDSYFNNINKIQDDSFEKDIIFKAENNISNQLKFMAIYNNYENISDKSLENRRFIIYEFPEAYISKLEELVYPEWYTACFMSQCTNSSVWGHYGDSHKGICLKFKIKQKCNDKLLPLKTIIGYGSNGPIEKLTDCKFEKINYKSNKFIEINFFESLGRLPVPRIQSEWYTDKDGNMSKFNNIIKFKDDWRRKYWYKFKKSITAKTKDWQYEDEYRIILNDMLETFKETKNRKIKYEFKYLDGIIFGIKTSMEDKIKITKIIEKKCKKEGRNDFNFYQARYCKKTGEIKPDKLNLLKFNV